MSDPDQPPDVIRKKRAGVRNAHKLPPPRVVPAERDTTATATKTPAVTSSADWTAYVNQAREIGDPSEVARHLAAIADAQLRAASHAFVVGEWLIGEKSKRRGKGQQGAFGRFLDDLELSHRTARKWMEFARRVKQRGDEISCEALLELWSPSPKKSEHKEQRGPEFEVGETLAVREKYREGLELDTVTVESTVDDGRLVVRDPEGVQMVLPRDKLQKIETPDDKARRALQRCPELKDPEVVAALQRLLNASASSSRLMRQITRTVENHDAQSA